MSDLTPTETALQGLLKVGADDVAAANTPAVSLHPLGVALWVLAVVNLVGGIALSVNAKLMFGKCKYSSASLCTSLDDFDATPVSELVSIYGWMGGITGFLCLGVFASILNLLRQIAVNTAK
jgi:hypothetical protein